MNLISKITGSTAFQLAMLAVPIEAGTGPSLDISSPPPIHFQYKIDFYGLLQRIQKNKDISSMPVKGPDGKLIKAKAYRLMGYNPQLNSDVQFVYLLIGKGVLYTRIMNSDYAPRDLDLGNTTEKHVLVIIEGGNKEIDGIPEVVNIETYKLIVKDKGAKQSANPRFRWRELDDYLTDKQVKQGVDGEYLKALTGTIFAQ